MLTTLVYNNNSDLLEVVPHNGGTYLVVLAGLHKAPLEGGPARGSPYRRHGGKTRGKEKGAPVIVLFGVNVLILSPWVSPARLQNSRQTVLRCRLCAIACFCCTFMPQGLGMIRPC